ncbi:hypothetical protein DFH94DRAFT_477898 [Russula ochroleuca]|uniref:Uncharacterized protein n=1 Tax=Russula ochroleuca TaxID=152965 RepID=A0A9P5T9S1_9AGAM|nr:hypothetical protein DFH94DRAFT_477898 [Russula ochroleuca]
MEERFCAQSRSSHSVHGNLLGSNVERPIMCLGPSRTAAIADTMTVSNAEIVWRFSRHYSNALAAQRFKLSDQFYSASHFLGEMKAKNMGAIKVLLDVAVNEGNNFKGS